MTGSVSNDQRRGLAAAVLAQAGQLVTHWERVVAQAGYEDLRSLSREDAAQLMANWLGYLPHGGRWPETLPQPSRRRTGASGTPQAGTREAAAQLPLTGTSADVPEAQRPDSGPSLAQGNAGAEDGSMSGSGGWGGGAT